MSTRYLNIQGGAVDLARGVVHRDDDAIVLTGREHALLAFLVERAGKTISRGTLLSEVFGYHPHSRSRVVDTILKRVRAKIGDDAYKPVHLVTVYGEGIRFVPLRDDTPHGLMGRDADLERLQRGTRHTVVVGPGGIGKTVLARAVACSVVGSLFIDLTTVRSHDGLIHTVGAAFGVTGAHIDEEAVHARIVGLSPRLVVLDNVEQLDAEALSQVDRWIRQSTTTRWCMTSRRDLGLTTPCERLVVGPLELDPSCQLLAKYVDAPKDELEALAARTGGNPLVLELAGTRARTFGVEGLLEHLSSAGLGALGQEGPARHAGVRSMIASTLSWVSPSATRSLSLLALLQGDFAAVDAASLLGDEVGNLDELTACHIVLVRRPGLLYIPVSTREVARERCPAGEDQRRAYLRWCSRRALSLSDRFRSADPVPAFVEAQECLAAWHDALERADLDLFAAAVVLAAYAEVRQVLGGPEEPAQLWSLPLEGTPDTWRLALARAAKASRQPQRALDVLKAGVAEEHAFERTELAAQCTLLIGRIDQIPVLVGQLEALVGEDRYRRGVVSRFRAVTCTADEHARWLRSATEAFRDSGALLPLSVAQSRRAHTLGMVLHQPEHGLRLAEDLVRRLAGLPPNGESAFARFVAGRVAGTGGRFDDAVEHLLRAREIAMRIGDGGLELAAYAGLAEIALYMREIPQARHLLEQAPPRSRAAWRHAMLYGTVYLHLELLDGHAGDAVDRLVWLVGEVESRGRIALTRAAVPLALMLASADLPEEGLALLDHAVKQESSTSRLIRGACRRRLGGPAEPPQSSDPFTTLIASIVDRCVGEHGKVHLDFGPYIDELRDCRTRLLAIAS